MNLWSFLMEMVMLLATAFALGAIAQRLRQSPIVGYLLAGTIIGPLLFNAEAVNQSAELGVSLLLFSIGLEFSLKRLIQMGRIAMVGGSVQVLVTMAAAAAIAMIAAGPSQALTIGAVAALSSTAVVMRVLVDRAEIDSVRGRSCLGILLLQDIAIVPLVLMVSLLTSTGSDMNVGLYIAKVIASAAGLTAGCYLLLYHLVPLVLKSGDMFANRELTVLLACVVGLGSAWAAHSLGISPALGAFLAGMLLGESPFAAQIRADIGSLRTIMVTLFFASVGMLAKPLWFLAHLHWILPAAAGVFLLKTVVIHVICRLLGLNRKYALATGITLGQIGEFSFVIATTARAGGIFNDALFDLVASTIILLIFAAPYMVAGAEPLAGWLLSRIPSRKPGPEETVAESDGQAPRKVILIGFGPAGRQVCQHLLEHRLEPVVIDVNPGSRKKGDAMGLHVHLGDAAQEDILLHAGLKQSCMAVVTLPDPKTSVRIVEVLRTLNPGLPIAVRCRYNRHFNDLTAAGAEVVIDEETVVGHTLAHAIVDFLQDTDGTSLACRLSGKAPRDPAGAPSGRK